MASIRYFRILKRLPLLKYTHQKCTLIENRALATSKALPVHADIQTRLWDRKSCAKGSQDHTGERPHRVSLGNRGR